jgi:hypothetical protein
MTDLRSKLSNHMLFESSSFLLLDSFNFFNFFVFSMEKSWIGELSFEENSIILYGTFVIWQFSFWAVRSQITYFPSKLIKFSYFRRNNYIFSPIHDCSVLKTKKIKKLQVARTHVILSEEINKKIKKIIFFFVDLWLFLTKTDFFFWENNQNPRLKILQIRETF